MQWQLMQGQQLTQWLPYQAARPSTGNTPVNVGVFLLLLPCARSGTLLRSSCLR